MNLYANWLQDVGKLVYIVGNYTETAQLKKVLDPADPRNRIFFRTYQDFPANALRKIKINGVREGILRADWLNKILERYPEMVIFMFNLGEQTEIQKVELLLRQILRKINLFFADVLKQNVKIVVTMTKAQAALPLVMEKVNYYMKSYQKDSFIVQVDNLGREIAKYKLSWLTYLQKNYQKKLRKLYRKLQQTVSNDKKLGLVYKIALISQIIGKDDRQRYDELIKELQKKFSEITRKDFNFIKYLDIRQIRILADVTALRFIKHRFMANTKDIPQFVQGHLNFFKMRSMDPNSCHFYFYHEELIWRSSFLLQVLEVLGAADLIQLLPRSIVAEWVNGLLSYLLKLATIPDTLLNELKGKVVDLSLEHYLGRYNYGDATDADMVITGTTELINRRKDYISKGIQLITRFKNLGLFKENQMNFLNIFLIRLYLADSKFAAITNIYNQILKVQVNRCNYFLINQLFNEIQGEMPKIDSQSRKFIYGITSLICDYFQNEKQLQKYLQLFFNQKIQQVLYEYSPQKQAEKSLFVNQLAPEAHIFKLKKNSSIFTTKILINQQIVLGNERYKIKFKFIFGQLLHQRLLRSKNFVQLKFNHNNMIYDIPIEVDQNEGLVIERELDIEPLLHVRRDNSLQIQELSLIMQNKNLVWNLQRNQLTFEKYDSTVFYTKISEPEVLIEDIKKVYYIKQLASFRICVKGLQGCKVNAKLSVTEDDSQGKTQVFMNKDQKMDLTNSKKHEQLLTGDDVENIFWIKCTHLNNKVLKLTIVAVVQKSFDVGWREKAVNLKSTYTIVKQIQFQVKNLFTITKTFRQAVTGTFCLGPIPINKKIILTTNIKANDSVQLLEVDCHKNPKKIKYHKSNKLNNLKLISSQSVNSAIIFQINQDCSQQIELFLMTLCIKWRRTDSTIENVLIDQGLAINTRQDKISISFEQKYVITQRKKGSLFVRVNNLTTEPTNIYIMMQSTPNLLRIGEKGKWQKLGAYQRKQIQFNILSIHAGIFEFPTVKAFIDNSQLNISTSNILIHCQ